MNFLNLKHVFLTNTKMPAAIERKIREKCNKFNNDGIRYLKQSISYILENHGRR